jgi:hypothetical protein
MIEGEWNIEAVELTEEAEKVFGNNFIYHHKFGHKGLALIS